MLSLLKVLSIAFRHKAANSCRKRFQYRENQKKDSLGGSLLDESDRDIKAEAGEMHRPGHNLVCFLAAGCIDAGNFAHLSCFCP